MLLSALLLILCLVSLWFYLRHDRERYAVFKNLTATEDRQRHYRRWLYRSFLSFGGVGLVVLGVRHRFSALMVYPLEFPPLHAWLRAQSVGLSDTVKNSVVVGGLFYFVLVLITSTALSVVLARKKKSLVVGDIEAIFPRNGAETVWTCLLALNAGLSEEIFFRLVLPLLLFQLFPNAWVAFGLALATFGYAHRYQGVVGILVTGFVGGLFTAIYMATASLWVVIALHSFLDLFNLSVRPAILRRFVPTR